MASDEQLVEQLAAGNEPALRELLRRYERALSNFLHRHSGGQDVEDLFQETWIRVVHQARRFDPALRFSTWLFQIAINLCRDQFRRRRRTTEIRPEHAVDNDSLLPVEARIDTTRLLAQLPEPQREVLILRYFHDLTEKQVAEIVGCPVGTVKSRLHHAVEYLSRRLDEEKK